MSEIAFVGYKNNSLKHSKESYKCVCRPSVCLNWLFIRILPFLELYSGFVSLSFTSHLGRWRGWATNTSRVLVVLSKAPPSPKLVLLPRACVKPPCAASHVLSVLFQTSTQDLGTVRFNKPLLGSNQAAERFSCGCHHPMESGSSAAESWATVAGGPWSDS